MRWNTCDAMIRMLQWIGYFRYVFTVLIVFAGVAILALVVKAGEYVYKIYSELLDAPAIRIMHDVLSLVDITLAAGLLMIIVGYILSQFIVSSGARERMPDWMVALSENADSMTIKVKISVTMVVIATILLLGEFVQISETSDAEMERDDGRLILMLLIHGALLLTAVAMAFVGWISKKPD